MDLVKEVGKRRDFFAGLAAGILVIVAIFWVLGFTANYAMKASKSLETAWAPLDMGVQGTAGTELQKIEVREGYVNIESKNAEADADRIKLKAEELNGFVESYGVSEGDYEKIVEMDVRVPSGEFDSFFYWVLENFEVKSSSARTYVVDVTLDKTEVDILESALRDLDEMKKRVKEGNVTAEKVDVLSRIVEKEVYFQERLARYAHSYAEARERSEYATLSVQIVEKKPVALFDRDVWREIALRLKESVEKMFEAVISVPVVISELFGAVIWWTLALAAVAVVLRVARFFFLWLKGGYGRGRKK